MIRAEDSTGRPATPAEQLELDRVVAEHAAAVAELNAQADFDARLAALPGQHSIHVSRGWVRHPDWRGALQGKPRKRGKR